MEVAIIGPATQLRTGMLSPHDAKAHVRDVLAEGLLDVLLKFADDPMDSLGNLGTFKEVAAFSGSSFRSRKVCTLLRLSHGEGCAIRLSLMTTSTQLIEPHSPGCADRDCLFASLTFYIRKITGVDLVP
eukprot:4912222-Amphidinium_carterae.1